MILGSCEVTQGVGNM